MIPSTQLILQNIYNGGGVGVGDFNNDVTGSVFYRQ
jgi:hypothetical protein